MTQEKPLRSLRFYVLLLVGLVLSAFVVVFFTIYTTSVPKMLLQAENSYLQKQMTVVEGIFEDAGHNTYMLADDMAVWDETVAFARGENPDYMAKNWPEDSPLINYRFNLLVIKDRNGKDLHVEFYDYVEGKPLPVPEGFADFLAPVSRRVLEKNPPLGPRSAPSTPIADWGDGGIIFYQGVPYYIACMPIMLSRESGDAEGTLTLGSILSNRYFQNLTHYTAVTFGLLPGEAGGEGEAIDRQSEEQVSASLPTRDMEGNPVRLVMSDKRGIYIQGRTILGTTTLMLMGITALFGLCVYQIVLRYVLRPVSRLRADLDNMESRGGLDGAAYGGTEEFAALCASINSLSRRLDQSRLSLSVLQSILDGMDAYVYVTDTESHEILFMNTKMISLLNLPESPAGKICWQVVMPPGQEGPCAHCNRKRLLADQRHPIVWEYLHKATGHYYRKTEVLIDWLDGKKAHLQHAVDITNIREAGQAVKKRLQQQELMAEISGSFIAQEDTDTLINNALRMTGEFMEVDKILMARASDDGTRLESVHEWYAKDDNCPRTPGLSIDFRPGAYEYDVFVAGGKPVAVVDDVTAMPESFSQAMENGIRSVIGVALHVNGRFWGVLSINRCELVRPWSESDVQLALLIGSVIAGVLTRAETEDNLTRMSSIVNSSPQFISYVDTEGRFEYVNPGGLKMLGFTEEELRAQGLAAILDEDTRAFAVYGLLPQIGRDGTGSFELPVRTKQGDELILAFTAFTTDFKTMGVGAIAADITKERELTEELVRAKDTAEQSSHAKSDFLSRMSHEMRTPLNAIIGMTSIATAAEDIEKKQYCLDKISEASAHLLGVINDILDMSKIEANKFELSFTEFNFEKMLHRVLNVVNFRVEEKNQTLIVDIADNVPEAIISDEQRLAQVIANLLSNAVKFTPDCGGITLRTEKIDENEGLCTLRIAVTDTGIGVSTEQQAKLFHSFEQADGGIARRFGGTGLGLAISKSIVELMGGSIWVESREGEGASFIFTIKAQIGVRKSAGLLRPDINWKDLRILVVDDAPEVLEYFKILSSSVNLRCEVAQDGESACAILQDPERGPFDIVFADWKMPGMDGLELTRRIKELRGSKTVVIMISATQWSDIEEQARQVGVDRFLPKPLFSSLIVNCINECLAPGQQALRPEEGRTQGPVPRKQARFKGRRILLAEDIEINREIVLSLLEPSGLIVDCAENGQEAVDKFAADPEGYDMIFMDIHMPEVDGYEATRRIRALDLPTATTIPIVAMTANVFREDIERCREAGMDAHVGKPIDIEEVFKILEKKLP